MSLCDQLLALNLEHGLSGENLPIIMWSLNSLLWKRHNSRLLLPPHEKLLSLGISGSRRCSIGQIPNREIARGSGVATAWTPATRVQCFTHLLSSSMQVLPLGHDHTFSPTLQFTMRSICLQPQSQSLDFDLFLGSKTFPEIWLSKYGLS